MYAFTLKNRQKPIPVSTHSSRVNTISSSRRRHFNNLWNYFLHLVEVERTVLEFRKEGYQIKLIPDSEYLEPNGILTKLPKCVKGIGYTIETTKDGVVDSYKYVKLV